MEDKTITLSTKPGASLHVSIAHTQPAEQNPLSDTVVVFINGLALPSAAWGGAIGNLIQLRKEANQPLPHLLSYDRFGQGKSQRDPTDAPDTPYGHDARTVIADLHQLLTQVARDELKRSLEELRLVFVCNSIGCPLSRLYAGEHPGRVEAFIFLDSMIANTDFISIFPDPDAADFDESKLPEEVSADDLRAARARTLKMFHPTVPNPEGLDRRNMSELLPHADGPALPDGPSGKAPLLVVVGHDFDTFAEQTEKGMGVPKVISETYTNPAWAAYNDGLRRLVPAKPEVKIAKGCGHFVQKDDPAFVANEINNILGELQSRK